MTRIGMVLLLVVGLAPATSIALDDPTRPYGRSQVRASTQPTVRGPVLQSTRISPTEKVATISGRRVAVGDTIDGAVVAEIRPYEVVLHKDGQDTTLRMLPRLEKNTKANE
jgi:hypothetical protein